MSARRRAHSTSHGNCIVRSTTSTSITLAWSSNKCHRSPKGVVARGLRHLQTRLRDVPCHQHLLQLVLVRHRKKPLQGWSGFRPNILRTAPRGRDFWAHWPERQSGAAGDRAVLDCCVLLTFSDYRRAGTGTVPPTTYSTKYFIYIKP